MTRTQEQTPVYVVRNVNPVLSYQDDFFDAVADVERTVCDTIGTVEIKVSDVNGTVTVSGTSARAVMTAVDYLTAGAVNVRVTTE